MKVMISADIEGVSGTTTWDEARKNQAVYREFQQQMTRETAAACEGALAAGASQIVVKDAHGDAGNIIHSQLPGSVTLVRGWSGNPLAMVQELDDSFDCCLFVGYHARAGSGGNPLSHTLSSRRVHRIFVNGREASEFYIHYLAAGIYTTPVVMLSGDKSICDEAHETNAAIHVAAVKDAHGASTINMHPDDAVRLIRTTSETAVREYKNVAPAKVPSETTLRIVFKEQPQAYYKAFYPGAELVDPYTVEFSAKNYFEILRALIFLV